MFMIDPYRFGSVDDPPPPAPSVATFISGFGEVLRGYGSEYVLGGGELLSSTFVDPTFEGVGSIGTFGGPVVFYLGSAEPIPEDAYTSVTVYDSDGEVFWEGQLEDAETSEDQYGDDNRYIRIWEWPSQGHPFNGTAGQQFTIEAQW